MFAPISHTSSQKDMPKRKKLEFEDKGAFFLEKKEPKKNPKINWEVISLPLEGKVMPKASDEV